MKTLQTYLKEELFAAPANTIGLSNVMPPTDTTVGSGDIPQPICIDIRTGKLYKRRKKFRRYRI